MMTCVARKQLFPSLSVTASGPVVVISSSTVEQAAGVGPTSGSPGSPDGSTRSGLVSERVVRRGIQPQIVILIISGWGGGGHAGGTEVA